MPVFSQVKQNMLKDSKFARYLLYAIGEIILVVIGILIALWFNKKSIDDDIALETRQTATFVIDQMTKENAEIKEVLTSWESLGATIDTVLYRTPNKIPVAASCEGCKYVLMGIELPTITDRIPKTIAEAKLEDGALKQKLLDIEFIYNQALETSKHHSAVILNSMEDNYKYWSDNYEWFGSFMSKYECKADCSRYFYESSDYRNKVAYFELLVLESYAADLDEFLKTNIENIKSLEAFLIKSEI